jgi:hypothetical protein
MENNPFFQPVSLPMGDAYSDFSQTTRASAENVTATDLDGDGMPELVFHLWFNPYNPGETDAFVPNRLAILDANDQGWKAVGSQWINSTPFAPNDLGGATRQNRVADLNGDGISDIAWSVNQEDGRNGDSDYDTLTSILISTDSGGHEVIAPGQPSWFHAVGARSYDADHAQPEGIVVAAGYSRLPEAFIIDKSNNVTVEDLPELGASTLLNLQDSAPDDGNIYFFTDDKEGPAILERTPAGQWSIADQASITDGLDMRIFYDVPAWNGDITAERTAYRYQGEWVAGFAPNDAAEIDLDGSGDTAIVAHVAGASLREADGTVESRPAQHLMFFDFEDGELTRRDMPITGYDSESNRNFIDVLDIDGDGLEDVISYDYVRSEGAPLFMAYRNTGEGRFEKLAIEDILPEPLDTTGSSLLRDFNGDGRLDILQWASDGGVMDPDEPSAVIHYAVQDWIEAGGAPARESQYQDMAYFRTVQEAYLAYYDRPADADGLLYWVGQLADSNGGVDVVIDAFAASPEAEARYGDINGGTIDEVVTMIYQGLFDRKPDTAGLAFYVDGYTDGDYTPGSIALDVAAGAVGEDDLLLENRISLAMAESLI